jgi:hypothetical protein
LYLSDKVDSKICRLTGGKKTIIDLTPTSNNFKNAVSKSIPVSNPPFSLSTMASSTQGYGSKGRSLALIT